MSKTDTKQVNSENLVNYSFASTSISDGSYNLDVIKPDSFSNLIKDHIIFVYSTGDIDSGKSETENK